MSARLIDIPFYHNYFALDADFSSLAIPAHQPGFDWLIVVPTGFTLNNVAAICRKHFQVYTCVDNLDAAVTMNERDLKSDAYILRVRNRVEADEELKKFSADGVRSRHLATMTLMERLVCEIKFFSETEQHLLPSRRCQRQPARSCRHHCRPAPIPRSLTRSLNLAPIRPSGAAVWGLFFLQKICG